MEKLFVLTTMLLMTAATWARPGYTKPVDVLQPDGSTVTLLMHGDEFLSFMTTTDGYTVVKGDGSIVATGIVARNLQQRTAEENHYLAQAGKYVHADMNEAATSLKERASQMYAHNYALQTTGKKRVQEIWKLIDYSKFKGLVVLVEWNDRKFGADDPKAFYQRMTNEKNLTDNSKKYYPVNVSGSVKDYFYDNSMGIFEPTFDVIGPISIDYSCKYPLPKNADGTVNNGFSDRMINILKAAMTKANAEVDFNNYDLNSDGIIDMVFFVFAGYGSYVQGNDNHYMWPHAEDLSAYSSRLAMIYDGKRFGRYACSMEIQDYEALASQHVWLDGIGTMCHEFSHVLGLADHYDTDYEKNGQAKTAGGYDVMDGGADWNYGLNPVGYSAFERHVLGFTNPEVIETPGNYELESFQTSNKAYIVKTKKNDEDFYIENRQKERWDEYLPEYGMLVWRVDASNQQVWIKNDVNISPDNMYLELLGNAPVSSLDLTPQSYSVWGEKEAATNLYSIRQQDNGNVTFEAGKDLYPEVTEDFESTPLTDTDATGIAGKFCTWDLANATIENTTADYGTGKQMVKLMRSGTLTTSVLENGLRSLKFTVQNGSQKVRFILKIMKQGETEWTNLGGATRDYKEQDTQLHSHGYPNQQQTAIHHHGNNSVGCGLS